MTPRTTGITTIHLPPDLEQKARELAKEKGSSVSAVIREALKGHWFGNTTTVAMDVVRSSGLTPDPDPPYPIYGSIPANRGSDG